MKALKITFLLLAVLMLTVSGLSSDAVKTDKKDPNSTDVNLIAHKKAKLKVPTQNG
ncbi:hypothetical protein [Psychroserpens sp. MEBiC05023]